MDPRHIFLTTGIATVLVIPLFGLAQVEEGFGGSFAGFVSLMLDILALTAWVLVALAFLVFFWGVAKFIRSLQQGGSDEDIRGGKQIMIWGVIAIFVMSSLGGILQLLGADIGLGGVFDPFLFEDSEGAYID